MSNTQEKQVSRLAQKQGLSTGEGGKALITAVLASQRLAQDARVAPTSPVLGFRFRCKSGGLGGEGQILAVYSRTLSVQRA